MRFRLSTILLVALCLCILLAWHNDRNTKRNDLANVWVYPNVDTQGSGYWDTFTINADGTFTKEQSYRGHSELFTGTYSVQPNGIVEFWVETKAYDLHGRNQPETYQIGKSYRCRCAVDSSENLIIREVHGETAKRGFSQPSDCDIIWESYSSKHALKQHHAERLANFNALMKQVNEQND